MSSIDVAYRAAIADHKNLRRKADLMGPTWVAVDESRSQRQPLAGRVFGAAAARLSAVKAALATSPPKAELGERQTAQ